MTSSDEVFTLALNMADEHPTAAPPPVTCASCGSAWPRLWVMRREIERCPYCRHELDLEHVEHGKLSGSRASA